MERIGDAFVWPFRDSDWPAKIAIIGLILIIPIAGAITGLGWMLAALDRLRAGDEHLPPANFDHLGRGLELFVVQLAYYAIVVVVGAVLYVPAVIILSAEGHGSPNGFLVAIGVGLLLLTVSVVTLSALALTFAMPAIVIQVSTRGLGGGFDVAAIFRRMRVSPINTLIAGLMLIAAGFVGQLGVLACFIGVFFTSAYALAMQAWIIRSFEIGSSAATSG